MPCVEDDASWARAGVELAVTPVPPGASERPSRLPGLLETGLAEVCATCSAPLTAQLPTEGGEILAGGSEATRHAPATGCGTGCGAGDATG
mmetsp:Transcript_105360/g.186136  ORF Transcript_105360/g.186136 Transcript_105360/m.186136 type:complete len:91 (-) Transcript_105360:104-376(-)